MNNRKPQLCGPDCRYRALYEGSQASLADLATKQASALGRVGRLRNGVVQALRQRFPKAFADAERALGRRMSNFDDEVLLAYLGTFLEQGSPTRLRALRAALTEAGYSLPDGDDTDAWAKAVASQMVPTRSSAGAAALDSLFAHEHTTPNTSANEGAVTAVQPPAQPERPAAPAAPTITPGSTPPPPPPAQNRTLRRPGQTTTTIAPPVATPTPHLNLDENPAADPEDVFADLFADEDPEDTAKKVTAGDSEDLIRDQQEGDSAANGPLLDDPLSSIFDEPAGEAVPVASWLLAPAPGVPVQTTSSPSAGSAGAPRSAPASGAALRPLRPELFPDAPSSSRSSRRKPPRTLRTSATPPDLPGGESVDMGGELTDDVRQTLLAAVCIPRPVFTSDLVNLTGNPDLVAAWESECLERRTQDIRFVNPKRRHAARGALVLPHGHLRQAATEFTKTTWGECLQRYRSTVLYELGVLLHLRGEELVGHRCGEHSVLLRLNQSRGLVGIVMTLDEQLEDTARAAVLADVEQLLSERLTLLVVLTPYAESTEHLIEVLTTEASRRRWAPTMPVIVGRSWEYASDRGASGVLVLGQ